MSVGVFMTAHTDQNSDGTGARLSAGRMNPTELTALV